ncbi:MAG: ABC transporter permease [Spirochaetales bacterium]|nr:ABC transporter permease [Spirochaetales bacterium]
MATQFFWGFIRIMILEAFYSSSAAMQPMTFSQVVTYVWLGQAFLGMLPWNVDRDVAGLIRDGSVAYELIRPLDLYWIWYARAMAWRTAATLLRSVPLLLFAALFLPLIGAHDLALSLPPHLGAFAYWMMSMLFALLLSCAITTLIHITMMWTVSGQGAGTIIPVAVTIFSGMIIPLPLFPDWMQLFLRLLPFHALFDTPARIFSGNITGIETIAVLFQQLGWTIAALLLGRLVIKQGLRRLVVQGG